MSISRGRAYARTGPRTSRAMIRRIGTVAATLVVGAGAAVVPASPALAATWTVVPSPNVRAFNGVDALSTTDVWAVGLANHATAPSVRPLAARWNGSTWTVVDTPVLSNLDLYASFNSVDGNASSNVWAAGSQETLTGGGGFTNTGLLERWNGSSWSVFTSPAPPGATSYSFHGVKTFSTTDAVAVGSYYSSGNRTLIQRWNGTSWANVSSPSPGASSQLFDVSGVAANDVWAVGYTSPGGTNPEVAGLILRWNGSSWSQVNVPAAVPDQTYEEIRFEDVVAIASNDVWVVGRALPRAGFDYVPISLHWNGQSWQRVAMSGGGGFNSVAALSSTKIYALAGYRIARWTGSAWVQETATVPGTLYEASATGTGTVWAVGVQEPGGGGTSTLTMRTTNG